jgi:hypothetical protein
MDAIDVNLDPGVQNGYNIKQSPLTPTHLTQKDHDI